MVAVTDLPTTAPRPQAIADRGIDALLRAAHAQRDVTMRGRDEALLALLIYAGLRAQEAADVQVRDLDLAAGTLTVRRGKGGAARRLPLHPDAQRLLERYLRTVRCPAGLPALDTPAERTALLLHQDRATPGQPWQPGITTTRIAQLVRRLGQTAAIQLDHDARHMADVTQAQALATLVQRLHTVSPHMLRHSLARRRLHTGAQLPTIQRVLGHRRLSTTGIYLTPDEDDVREALGRAGV